jgi:tetratricopeptide (TPR) repeat protein
MMAIRSRQEGVPADLIAAIQQQSVANIRQLMFEDRDGPTLRSGFFYENELWDYKVDCPDPGNKQAWASVSKDVLAFHNQKGGLLIFGVSDDFKFVGATRRLDSKQFNDGIRTFLSDTFWVHFHREFIQHDQRYLGIAVIPARGARFERFRQDAPSGKKTQFIAGNSAIRKGDQSVLLPTQEADVIQRQTEVPVLDRMYSVDEPCFRILAPDYNKFVSRSQCVELERAMNDERASIISLVGIGGVGKTSLATWAVTSAFQSEKFDFIVSMTAKDRELTTGGTRGLAPTITTFESILDQILVTCGFGEHTGLDFAAKRKDVANLLRSARGLVYIDNLETLQDDATIEFLENMPNGSRAVITSRKTRVRRHCYPIDVGLLTEEEGGKFLASLRDERKCGYLDGLSQLQRKTVLEDCGLVALAIKWTAMRAKSVSELLSKAQGLKSHKATLEMLLEFSFRQIYQSLDPSERSVLEILALFNKPSRREALLVGTNLANADMEAALDNLIEDGLMSRYFDSENNCYTYSVGSLTQAFVNQEMNKSGVDSDAKRKRLRDWYEARDADPSQRDAIRQLRTGATSPESALLDLARSAEKNERFQEACDLYQQALQLKSTSWQALQSLGNLHKYRLSDRRKALDFYQKAAEVAPSRGAHRGIILREYGLLLKDSGEPQGVERAIEKLEAALQEIPGDGICLCQLGYLLDSRGHTDRIIALLEPHQDHENLRTRDEVLKLLEKTYDSRRDLLKLASLRSRK